MTYVTKQQLTEFVLGLDIVMAFGTEPGWDVPSQQSAEHFLLDCHLAYHGLVNDYFGAATNKANQLGDPPPTLDWHNVGTLVPLFVEVYHLNDVQWVMVGYFSNPKTPKRPMGRDARMYAFGCSSDGTPYLIAASDFFTALVAP